jgi:hypothetical protein
MKIYEKMNILGYKEDEGNHRNIGSLYQWIENFLK